MAEAFLPIHAGLAKAGSTYLQHCVFPELFPDAPMRRDLGTKLSKDEAVRFLDGEEPAPGTLLSWENFSSAQSGNPGKSWINFERFLQRIPTLETPPRVLFVIREHEGWLRSEWIDRMKKCKPTDSFASFAAQLTEADLSWHARIEALQALDVPLLVIRQDDLATRTAETVELIRQFWQRPPVDFARVEQRAASGGRTNINPKTGFSLAIARFTRRRKLLVKLAVGIARITADRESVHPRSVQDAFVRLANRWPFGRPLRDTLQLPTAIRTRCDADWQRAITHATRPEDTHGTGY